jgi:hypothetical protein
MARIKLVPNIPALNNFVQNPLSPEIEDLSFVAGYVFRAKILTDRTSRGFERAEIQGTKDAFETSGLPIFETDKLAREKQMRTAKGNRTPSLGVPEGAYEFEPAVNPYTTGSETPLSDTISIIDYDFGTDRGRRGYQSMTLPFVPRDLSYEPSSKFVGIATMGRNNPHYHFTGSEDTLQFDIDWFSNQADRKDVINNCRWVEALTKADAYTEAPHRVKLVWGSQDLLFANSIWIVVAAPYTLSDFVKGYRDPTSKQIIRIGMLPQQAYQKVTLKRIASTNLRSMDIISNQ